MREIKFRLFLAGHWHYWGFVSHAGFPTFASLPSSNVESLSMEEMQERSQQFTGLKDKNGKEIYEGDIVSGIFYDEPQPENHIAGWSDKLYGFTIGGYPMSIHGLHDLEIIGNIHEHPNLIESETIPCTL